MRMRPIVEIQFSDFITHSMDQLVNQAAKLRYMFGGKAEVPLVLRTPGGAGTGAAAQHSQSLEAWFIHVPGLKVVMPSTPYDAKGMLLAALDDPNPVIFYEHKLLYNRKGDVPEEPYRVPLGEATVSREGADVTLAAAGLVHSFALEAAEALSDEGIEAEVIDCAPSPDGPRDCAALGGEDRQARGGRGGRKDRGVGRRAGLQGRGERELLRPRPGARQGSGGGHPDPLQQEPRSLYPSHAGEGGRGRALAPERERGGVRLMAAELKVPTLGMDMEEATILRWLVEEGTAVEKGDPVLEIETDKTSFEIEANGDGEIRDLRGEEGETLPVGTVLAYIAAPGEEIPEHEEAGREVPEQESPEIGNGKAARADESIDQGPEGVSLPEPNGDRRRVRASPAARRAADERELDLEDIVGSGPHGRIYLSDVLSGTQTWRRTGGGAFSARASGDADLLPGVALPHPARRRGANGQELRGGSALLPDPQPGGRTASGGRGAFG